MAETSLDKRHEDRDADVRALTRIAIGGVLLTLLVVFGVYFLFRGITEREAERDVPPPALAGERVTFTGPRLQSDPQEDLRRIRASEEERLSSYGWLDEERGLVHIPIERAMELIVERGLPVRQPQTSEEEP